MNKRNKNNEAKYICLLCTQPYKEPPPKNCIQCTKCLQWCYDRLVAKYFFVQFLSGLIFLPLPCLYKKMFLFDFLVATKQKY